MINKIVITAFSCILITLILVGLTLINRKQIKVYINNVVLFCTSVYIYLILVFALGMSVLVSLGVAYAVFFISCIIFRSRNEDIDNIVRMPVMIVLLFNLINNLKQAPEAPEPIVEVTQNIGEILIEDSRSIGKYESCVKICQNGFVISSSNDTDTVFPSIEGFIVDSNTNSLAEGISIGDGATQNISTDKGIKLGIQLNVRNSSTENKNISFIFRIKKSPNKIGYNFLGQKMFASSYIDSYGGLIGNRVVRGLPLQNTTWFGLTDPRLCYYMKSDDPFKEAREINNCIYIISAPIEISSESSQAFNLDFLTTPRRFDVISAHPEFRSGENLFNYSFIPFMSKAYKFLFITLEKMSNHINPILALILILLGITVPLSVIYAIYFRQTGKNFRRIIEIMSEKGGPESAMPSIVQYVYNSRLSRNKVILYVCFLFIYYLLSLFPMIQIRNSGVFFKLPFLWISDLTLPIDPYNIKNLIQFCTKIDIDSITILRYIFKINPSLTSIILFLVQYVSIIYLSSKSNPDSKSTTARILFISCILLGSVFTPILAIGACIYQIVSKVEEYLPKLFDKHAAILHKRK